VGQVPITTFAGVFLVADHGLEGAGRDIEIGRQASIILT
jgi:hypothetical protein